MPVCGKSMSLEDMKMDSATWSIARSRRLHRAASTSLRAALEAWQSRGQWLKDCHGAHAPRNDAYCCNLKRALLCGETGKGFRWQIVALSRGAFTGEELRLATL